jgi:hypothetical protein
LSRPFTHLCFLAIGFTSDTPRSMVKSQKWREWGGKGFKIFAISFLRKILWALSCLTFYPMILSSPLHFKQDSSPWPPVPTLPWWKHSQQIAMLIYSGSCTPPRQPCDGEHSSKHFVRW